MTALFSTADLIEMRAFSLVSMTDTARRAPEVQNTVSGETTYTYTPSTTDVPCRLTPLGQDEQLADAQEEGRAEYLMVLPWDTTVALTDRWVVAGDMGTVTVSVVGTEAPRSNGIDLRVHCTARGL